MTVARKKAAHAQRGKAELNPHDALVLLTAEHNEIDKLAREFERIRKTASSVDKGKAALRLCHALEGYAAIKHEVFTCCCASRCGRTRSCWARGR